MGIIQLTTSQTLLVQGLLGILEEMWWLEEVYKVL
jgi:hypothetical protein